MTVNNFLKENQDILELYTKTVAKVHGDDFPEVIKVRNIYLDLEEKRLANNNDFAQEFEALREATNNYAIPEGACETFAATYKMLKKADDLYTK